MEGRERSRRERGGRGRGGKGRGTKGGEGKGIITRIGDMTTWQPCNVNCTTATENRSQIKKDTVLAREFNLKAYAAIT